MDEAGGGVRRSVYVVYVLYFCGICAVCTLINVLFFSLRVSSSGSMRSRNAVRAVGGGLLTSIHEYRISCNRSPRLALEQIRYVCGRRRKACHGSTGWNFAAGNRVLAEYRCFCFANVS